MAPIEPLPLSRHLLSRTTDLEEFGERLNAVYYPARLSVRGRHGGPAVLHAVHGPDLTAGYVQPGRDVQVIPVRESTTAFHINFAHRGRLLATTGDLVVPVEGTVASVHNPGSEHALHHWEPMTGVVGVKLSQRVVEEELEKLLGVPLEAPLRFEPVLDLDSAAGRGWLALVRLILTELDDPAVLRDERIRDHYVRTLAVTTLTVQPQNYSEALRTGGSPAMPRTLRRAVDHIEQHFASPLTVGDIAAAGGTSVRRLQEVFRERFEVTPMTYLRNVRLDHARELLRGGQTEVTEAARASGLTHLGRFAAAYQERFGELPSQTRRG